MCSILQNNLQTLDASRLEEKNKYVIARIVKKKTKDYKSDYVLYSEPIEKSEQSDNEFYHPFKNYSEQRNILLDKIDKIESDKIESDPIEWILFLNEFEELIRPDLLNQLIESNPLDTAIALKMIVNNEFYNYDIKLIKKGIRYIYEVREKPNVKAIIWQTEDPIISKVQTDKEYLERTDYHLFLKTYDLKYLKSLTGEERFICLIELAKLNKSVDYLISAAKYGPRSAEAYYYLFIVTGDPDYKTLLINSEPFVCYMPVSIKLIEEIKKIKNYCI